MPAGRGEGGGLVVGVVRGQAMVEAAEELAEDSRTESSTLFPGKPRMSGRDVGAEAPNFLYIPDCCRWWDDDGAAVSPWCGLVSPMRGSTCWKTLTRTKPASGWMRLIR